MTLAKYIARITLFLIFTAFAALLVLSSCTPEQRLKRLIKRHPHLLNSADTIVIRDTAIIQASTHDTIFSISQLIHSTDTIRIVKDRITQKVYYKHDSLYIYAHCKPDTVILEKHVISKTVDVAKLPPPKDWSEWVYKGMLALFVLGICLKIVDAIFYSHKS